MPPPIGWQALSVGSFTEALRTSALGVSVLLAGCGLEPEPNRCPDGNTMMRKALVHLEDAEVHLLAGNAYILVSRPHDIAKVIQANPSAQRTLDDAFATMNSGSIDRAIGRANLDGTLTVCIPSGDIGLKVDALSVSGLRPLKDAEIDAMVAQAVASQDSRYPKQRLLRASKPSSN